MLFNNVLVMLTVKLPDKFICTSPMRLSRRRHQNLINFEKTYQKPTTCKNNIYFLHFFMSNFYLKQKKNPCYTRVPSYYLSRRFSAIRVALPVRSRSYQSVSSIIYDAFKMLSHSHLEQVEISFAYNSISPIRHNKPTIFLPIGSKLTPQKKCRVILYHSNLTCNQYNINCCSLYGNKKRLYT